MPTASAQELFLHELSEIHDAEHRFVEGQQETIGHAADEDLKAAIKEHLEQTRQERTMAKLE